LVKKYKLNCAFDLVEDFVFLSVDNSRFFNHSYNPNTKNLGVYDDNIALSDIHIGEEITINYNEIDVNGINFQVK